ncbi:MAG: hypothetical protein JNK82_10620 [Myxococcaceae bacterium]|nr:hypothetical protein [Myxococcaceae bacterium]
MNRKLLFVLCFASACGAKGPIPELPSRVAGHCTYVNGFSKLQECRDYVGDWTDDEARRDCAGQGAEIVLGSACGIEERLGYCILGKSPLFARITFPGSDASQCSSLQRGCEFFGGGIFDPAPVCGGVTPTTRRGLPVFQQPTLSCVAPKAGEPAGKGPEGKVCTWEMISGATEEGRAFEDYASCDRVRTQRPYIAVPPNDRIGRPDPRLSDPAYVRELDWVKGQIRASACVCCHSNKAPEGASNWYLEAGPNFIDSFLDRGLAMGAGWVDTVGFGAYPPEQNNGFERATPEHPERSIFPTTDGARMVRFFEAEAALRGVTKSAFGGQYGAGPLDDQRFYVPTACSADEGIDSAGVMRWLNGPARYVYVLEEGSKNPTAPPNLDRPAGTLWRIDVPHTGQPLNSGEVTYGVTPAAASQQLPATGSPPALVSGRTYLLYVLKDVAQPSTRCLFKAP